MTQKAAQKTIDDQLARINDAKVKGPWDFDGIHLSISVAHGDIYASLQMIPTFRSANTNIRKLGIGGKPLTTRIQVLQRKRIKSFTDAPLHDIIEQLIDQLATQIDQAVLATTLRGPETGGDKPGDTK